MSEIPHDQSMSALIIFVSAAHVALFSKIMSGAHRSAHFLNVSRALASALKNSSALFALTKIFCALFALTLKVKECLNFCSLTEFKVINKKLYFENKIIFSLNLC